MQNGQNDRLFCKSTRPKISSEQIWLKEVMFPALHITLGIATQFVKALLKLATKDTSKEKKLSKDEITEIEQSKVLMQRLYKIF